MGLEPIRLRIAGVKQPSPRHRETSEAVAKQQPDALQKQERGVSTWGRSM